LFVWKQEEQAGPAVVTGTLIGLNIFIHFIVLASRQDPGAYGLATGAFNPWSLLTAPFVHGGFLHLLGNMYFLWVFGRRVEGSIGRVSFILLYLLFGFIAGLADGVARLGSTIPAIGASGAISGVMAMYAVLFPKARFSFFSFTKGVQNISSVGLISWFLVMDLLGGIMGGDGVAHFAHLGGTFAGFLFGGLLSGAGLVESPPPAPAAPAAKAPMASPGLGPRPQGGQSALEAELRQGSRPALASQAPAAARPRSTGIADMSPEKALAAAKRIKAAKAAEAKGTAQKFWIAIGTGLGCLILNPGAAVIAFLVYFFAIFLILGRLALVALFPMVDTPGDYIVKALANTFWGWYGLFCGLWLLLAMASCSAQ
jgi:membrane associated rhomboid family serine protease